MLKKSKDTIYAILAGVYASGYITCDLGQKMDTKSILTAEDMIHKEFKKYEKIIQKLITEEIIVAQHEGDKTSRLTSLWNKIEKI